MVSRRPSCTREGATPTSRRRASVSPPKTVLPSEPEVPPAAETQSQWLTKEEPTLLAHLPPQPAQRAQYVLPHLVETAFSNVPILSCRSTNTPARRVLSSGMLHGEGGWPQQVDPDEADERVRHAKRAQRDASYLSAVAELTDRVSHPLRINAAIDIFSDYFEPPGVGRGAGMASTSPSGDPVTSFGLDALPIREDADAPSSGAASSRTPRPPHFHPQKRSLALAGRLPRPAATSARIAKDLTWLQADPTTLLAIYAPAEGAVFAEKGVAHANDSRAGALWDVGDAVQPLVWLAAPSGLSAGTRSPREPSLVLCGSATGIVCVYDLRQRNQQSYSTTTSNPAALRSARSSSLHTSHSGPVEAVRCNASKSVEFLSGGADGLVMLWDARSLDRPLQVMPLPAAATHASSAAGDAGTDAADLDGSSRRPLHGITCLDYDAVNAPSNKLLLGTAEGTVLLASRLSATGLAPAASPPTAVSGTPVPSPPPSAGPLGDRLGRATACYGPVRGVARHPQHSKAYLSAGDWGLKLFVEELRTPIRTTPYLPSRISSCAWHPLHAGLALAGTHDGRVVAYDWRSQAADAVVFTTSVSAAGDAITSIAPHPTGQMVACGDAGGTVTLLHAPEARDGTAASSSDRGQFAAMLERDTARERSAAAAREASKRTTKSAAGRHARHGAVFEPEAGGAKRSPADDAMDHRSSQAEPQRADQAGGAEAALAARLRQIELDFLDRVRRGTKLISS